MLYAFTIFVSAFLLFLAQPLIAKQILPWFGGTAAVWTVCLLFFQLVLLAGYTYAHWLSRLAMRRQAIVHTVLAVAACLALPIIADPGWKPAGEADPTWRILLLLAATIGLPYLTVCATGPLVQSWFARVHEGAERQARVYRLFALSNLASLVALVAYPFALEPFATLRQQSWGWSAGFLLFAVLVVASAWRTERRLSGMAAPARPDATDALEAMPEERALPAERPSWAAHALWLALAAVGTVMLLAVTTHITQDVASVPFLWILPLALYLLTFILCFDSSFWYRRWFFWPATLLLAPAMAWGLGANNGVMPIRQAIPLFSAGLFAVCMFCHGELMRARPAPAFLTRFYLMISLGGALGGMFVGVAAPRLFNGYWEMPLALIAACLLLWVVARATIQARRVVFMVGVLAGFAWFLRSTVHVPENETMLAVASAGAVFAALVIWRSRSVRTVSGLAAGAAFACCLWFGWAYADFIRRDVVAVQRNFYGTLRVHEYGQDTPEFRRMMMHGVIAHGQQYVDGEFRRRPTSYYSETSGIGVALASLRVAQPRIGVVGLGAGTLAAYGKAGGTFRYYEINPVVVDLARSHFTYLSDTPAKVEMALGDARLVLEKEAAAGGSQQFDLLLIDAFSSDSIPVHLMTREAMAVYRKHLKPDAVLAFHISNRYLNLAPVVAQLAFDAGMQAVRIGDQPGTAPPWRSSTDYVLVTNNQAFLDDAEIVRRGVRMTPVAGLPLWTDDYNNLFKILR